MSPQAQLLRQHVAASILVAVVLLTSGGLLSAASQNDAGNKAKVGKPRPTAKKPATQEAVIYAAIDDAVRRLKARDFRGFLIYHAPVDYLRQLRKAGNLDEVLAQIKQNPEAFDRIADLLAEARKAKPEFDATKTEATLRIVESEEEEKPAKSKPEDAAPKTTNVKLTGFGSDLAGVLDKAIAALEKGDVETFVKRMFPAGELRRPDADKRRTLIVNRLKANPAPVKQMIADLKAVKKLKPKFEDAGRLAVFKIPGGTREAGRRKIALPARTIKLQEVAGSWRLYDHTSPTREEVARQANLALPKFTPQQGTFVKFERIGDAWRILKLNF